MIDINGHWIGFYSYGKGYSELNKIQTVPFNVTIEKGLKEFVGIVTEEIDYGGIEDEIMIRGQLDNDKIEFVKCYTLEHGITEDNEAFSIESDNPNTVYYRGQYFDNENKFKGEWELAGLREDEEGVFHEDNQTGYWEMWKE